ncbi:hypothetical protein HPB49_025817 [Dermacentor silvarum]|nr:hypothetical protein HPB49_025817 [Dermacentor silvarum]
MDLIIKGIDENRALQAIVTENDALKKENEALRHKVSNLEKNQADCKTNLANEKTEQYSSNRNLEIKGAVKQPNENLAGTLNKIDNAIGEPITRVDVDVCHSGSTKDASKQNIIAQCQRRDKRDKLLHKVRKAKLTDASLGLPKHSSAYVNEHLSSEIK